MLTLLSAQNFSKPYSKKLKIGTKALFLFLTNLIVSSLVLSRGTAGANQAA
jgi:hypothetical protein